MSTHYGITWYPLITAIYPQSPDRPGKSSHFGITYAPVVAKKPWRKLGHSSENALWARVVYEAILENGPLDTVRLRREARMSAGSAKSRFDRALVELQVGLKVVPTGVAEAGAWNYAFIYELFQRWFPEIPERARSIKRGEARRVLVQRYIDNAVAADRNMIAKVFHVLKWTSRELDRTVTALLGEDAIREIPFLCVLGICRAQCFLKHSHPWQGCFHACRCEQNLSFVNSPSQSKSVFDIRLLSV